MGNLISNHNCLKCFDQIGGCMYCAEIEGLPRPDKVNHPAHYELLDGVEVLDVIKASLTEEQLKGYFMGNCIKYLCRANKKNGDEDLAKMEFYARELMDG